MKTPAPGLFRKLLFSLMLAGILASLMELGSFTTLWILTGEAFTPARAAVERERVLQQVEALSNQRALESELERSERPAIVPEDQGNLAPEVMHPFLGYVRDPNFEDPLFAMNPLGLYASRPALPTGEAARGEPGEADLVSVGIFGGSVAVGLARAPSLVAELRRSPALAGKRLWIRIFALGGYKQPQQLIALNYALALGEKLDIVINLDGFNDIALAPAPHRSAGLATHFPSRWHLFASSIRSVEIQRLVGEIAYFESVRGERTELCASLPLAWSPTCHLIFKTLDFRASQRLTRLRAALERSSRSEPDFRILGPQEEFADDEELLSSLVELWSAASLQMHQLCSARGIRYYHFLQPNQYLPGSKELTLAERREAFHEGQPWAPLVPVAYPKLASAGADLEAQGVRFEDMSMLFSDVSETLYIDTCCHLNSDGTRRLATAIAAEVVRDLDPDRDADGLSDSIDG